MTAFFIATVQVKDTEKFQDYAARAAVTFQAHGGEMIMRGRSEQVLAGEGDNHAVGIVKFPNMAALEGWYGSDDYQAIIPLRDEAADMKLVAYSVPS